MAMHQYTTDMLFNINTNKNTELDRQRKLTSGEYSPTKIDKNILQFRDELFP